MVLNFCIRSRLIDSEKIRIKTFTCSSRSTHECSTGTHASLDFERVLHYSSEGYTKQHKALTKKLCISERAKIVLHCHSTEYLARKNRRAADILRNIIIRLNVRIDCVLSVNQLRGTRLSHILKDGISH